MAGVRKEGGDDSEGSAEAPPGLAGAPSIAATVTFAFGTASFASPGDACSAVKPPERISTLSKRLFHDDMRQLWEDHVAEILGMADTLSLGIIKQFPDRFA
jgi:hypothetical protein